MRYEDGKMGTMAWAITSLMIGVAMAGCVLPEFGGGDVVTGAATAIKQVVVTINDQTEDMDRVEDVIKTSFEYTHKGSATEASSITVAYTRADGKPATESMARFHSGTLRDGDVVRITGANLTSGLRLTRGADILYERSTLNVPWLKAGGYPLPIHTSSSGDAEYALSAKSDLTFRTNRFEPGEDFVIERASAAWGVDFDGTMTAQTKRESAGTNLSFATELDGTVSLEAEATYTSDGESETVGGKVSVTSTTSTLMAMIFDNTGNLRTVGYGGHQYVDGQVQIWNNTYPKSANHEPDELEHPFLDERFGWDEEDVYEDPNQAERIAVSFLSKLWSAGVEVGDEFRINVEFDEGGFGFSFDLITQITQRESRTVRGGTFDSFRVSQTTEFRSKGAGGAANFETTRFTYWIDTASHMLVFAQGSMSRTFSATEIRDLLGSMGQEVPERLPSDFSLVLGMESSVELETYTSDLRTAPIVGVNGMGMYAGLLGAVAIASLGYSDRGYEEAQPVAAPPRVSFNFEADADANVIRVMFVAGDDALKAWDWYVSVVPAASDEVFETYCTFDFRVGDLLVIATTSEDWQAYCDDFTVDGGPTTIGPGMWSVRIFHAGSDTLLADATIEV